MPYPSLILLVTAALQAFMGLFVIRHNPRGPVHRAVAWENFLMLFWAAFTAMVWVVADTGEIRYWGQWAHAASLLAITGFVVLCLIYPTGRSSTPAYLRLGLWVAAAVVSLAVVLSPDLILDASVSEGRMVATYGILRYAYFGHVTLCFLWGLSDMALRFRHAQGIYRGQMEYLLVGLALTGLLCVPPNIVGPLLGFHAFAWMGPSFSLVFLGFIAHAIVRHRLMGIRVFVARWSANLLAVGIAAGLFWVILFILQDLGRPAGSVVALALALAIQPLRMVFHTALSRYFFRPEYDYQATVRDASRALAATLDLRGTADYLLATVSRTLQVEHALVLVQDRVSASYRVYGRQAAWAGPEDPPQEAIGVSSDSPLIAQLERTREALVREELEQSRDVRMSGEIVAEMAHFHADVAVPLLSGNLLRAVLLVGPKIAGDFFTSQDIDLLSTLGAEAGAAVANAQLHQEAIQADRLATLGGLAAGIAHEVKNPLVAVRTFAELLPEKHDDPEFRDGFSELVVREVDRIDRLIGQLLSYARPTPPRLEAVDLNAVIGDTLQFLSYEFTRHAIAVSTALTPELPSVMADAQQLRQVVLNIALNAAQVMPDGGRLRVTTRAIGRRGDRTGALYLLQAEEMVEMEMANTGPGIPEANLERIFEPFYSTRSEGTGLGLSICKRIVTGHHGQIRATITGDGLTAFVVGLPAAGRKWGSHDEAGVDPQRLRRADAGAAA